MPLAQPASLLRELLQAQGLPPEQAVQHLARQQPQMWALVRWEPSPEAACSAGERKKRS